MTQDLTPGQTTAADAIAETHRLIEDLDRRIVRQKRRVEKIILERVGPREEMEMLLKNMIEARDMMQKQVETFERDPQSHTDVRWTVDESHEPVSGS